MSKIRPTHLLTPAQAGVGTYYPINTHNYLITGQIK